MASLPITSWPYRAALAGGILALLAAGCHRTPGPGPTASTTPTAVASGSPQAGADYAAITARYQADVVESDNGWPVIKPLLAPTAEDAQPLSERLDSGLESPEEVSYFDQQVLPVLQVAFRKPFFFEACPLLSGRDPLNFYYRDLRRVCDLVNERADQLWKEGKKTQALELLELPLGLASAMQARPETVSVNLFSGPFYANSALRTLAEWASDNSLQGAELSQAAQLLARHRPSYQHIADSILPER
jgi:hypothetical protein